MSNKIKKRGIELFNNVWLDAMTISAFTFALFCLLFFPIRLVVIFSGLSGVCVFVIDWVRGLKNEQQN